MSATITRMCGWDYIFDKDMGYHKSVNVREITGKYLFFSFDKKLLIDVAKREIDNNGFNVGKISIAAIDDSYVLCLYWEGPDRKYELANKYKAVSNLAYRYWKSNEDTHNGKYSVKLKENKK